MESKKKRTDEPICREGCKNRLVDTVEGEEGGTN